MAYELGEEKVGSLLCKEQKQSNLATNNCETSYKMADFG